MRFLVFAGVVVIGFFCQAQKSEDAREWLINTVENFFAQPYPHFKTITTEQYAEYKQDAINVIYDVEDNLTEEGSHIRLTTNEAGTHHITVPNHRPIKIGTLSRLSQTLRIILTYQRRKFGTG